MRNPKIYRVASTPIVTLLALLFLGSTITAAPGDLDPTFSGDEKLLDWLSRSDDSARGIAVQTDGKIVVAGSSVTGLSSDFSIVRYNTDGSLDTTFGSGGGDCKVTTGIAAENRRRL
jgi:uncharacterized delta-60 repeat protein